MTSSFLLRPNWKCYSTIFSFISVICCHSITSLPLKLRPLWEIKNQNLFSTFLTSIPSIKKETEDGSLCLMDHHRTSASNLSPSTKRDKLHSKVATSQMHNPSVMPFPNECCQSLKEQIDWCCIYSQGDIVPLFLILYKMTSNKILNNLWFQTSLSSTWKKKPV